MEKTMGNFIAAFMLFSPTFCAMRATLPGRHHHFRVHWAYCTILRACMGYAHKQTAIEEIALSHCLLFCFSSEAAATDGEPREAAAMLQQHSRTVPPHSRASNIPSACRSSCRAAAAFLMWARNLGACLGPSASL